MFFCFKSIYQWTLTNLSNRILFHWIVVRFFKKIAWISRGILEGLRYLHENGILHRDLKPPNILLNKKLEVKICDFGSAISEDHRIDGSFPNEGFTTWYKSPEILFGSKAYDYKTDIWSFGCVFGELLNGIPVFPGLNDFQ